MPSPSARRRAPLVPALLLAGCLPGGSVCEPVPPLEAPALRVLDWNVGHGSTERGPYALHLADQAYEDHVGAQIRARDADVVALQELLTAEACATIVETDPALTCHDPSRPPPVRRLLGPDYTIVCDGGLGEGCIGVHTRLGRVRGVGPAALLSRGQSLPLPFPPCDYTAGECDGKSRECDAQSFVIALDVDTARGPLRLVHVHATAIGNLCRQRQIVQALEAAGSGPAVLMGDWNFDPDVVRYLSEAALWNGFVGGKRRLVDHGERDLECIAVPTSANNDLAIDRVVSSAEVGRCRTWFEPRLDAGFDVARLPDFSAPIDHHAVECELTWPRSERR